MSNNKDKRKLNKRSGSFRLDPSSSLYSGDKTSSSFGESAGNDILNSEAFHDAITDVFNYNQNAKLSKDELDQIIKSAIEDAIRAENHSDELSYEDTEKLVNSLFPEVVRMYKKEYSQSTLEEDKLDQLIQQANSEDEEESEDEGEIMAEAKIFTRDSGEDYVRAKELDSWTDPNGEIHKLFVAYHKETDEPHWFITYDIYDDIDWDCDSEEEAYEWFEGLKNDYEDDDDGHMYEAVAEDDENASDEQMQRSYQYLQDNAGKLNNKHSKISTEYDTANAIVTVEIEYDDPEYMCDESLRDLHRLPYKFEFGKNVNDQYQYSKDTDEKEICDTGSYMFDDPDEIYKLISRAKDDIDDILYEYEEDPSTHWSEDHPNYKPYDAWADRGMSIRDFLSDSVNNFYRLVKTKEGYSLKTKSDKLPLLNSVVRLSDDDIITLNESTKIIEKKNITKDDEAFDAIDKFYKSRVGGKK